jgi:hypothetical protein
VHENAYTVQRIRNLMARGRGTHAQPIAHADLLRPACYAGGMARSWRKTIRSWPKFSLLEHIQQFEQMREDRNVIR